MIEILKTVMGAVATKDMVPVLTHFCLYEGRVQGCNGIVYVDAPFPHDVMECAVPAQRFLKAVEACDDEPTFGITEGGKLSVKHGKFRAYIPVLPSVDFPRAALDGAEVAVPDNFIATIARLKPFVSEDASRPWSMAILMRDNYAYASNNIILMRSPLPWEEREAALPVQLIDRLLEINQNPDQIFIGPTHVSFAFGDTWLRSQLVDAPWPTLGGMFDEQATEPVPEELKVAIEKIKHFCVNEKFPIIRLSDVVQTDEGEQGASYEGFSFPEAAFHADQLLKALSVATHINFTAYPKPCAIKGASIEGLIVGIKK